TDIDAVQANDCSGGQTAHSTLDARFDILVLGLKLDACKPETSHQNARENHKDERTDCNVICTSFHVDWFLYALSAARPRIPPKYSWIQGFGSSRRVLIVP